MEHQPDRSLAHCRLVEAVGEGGVGGVWEADGTRLGRRVAIKILPEDFAQAAERIAEGPVPVDETGGDFFDREPLGSGRVVLVLVADGFFECENPDGEQFGLERRSQTIRQAKAQPSREMIGSLHSAVLQLANGTEQLDDLAAVIVKRERKGLTSNEEHRRV